MSRLWLSNGRVLLDAAGRLRACPDCPCPDGTGTGTGVSYLACCPAFGNVTFTGSGFAFYVFLNGTFTMTTTNGTLWLASSGSLRFTCTGGSGVFQYIPSFGVEIHSTNHGADRCIAPGVPYLWSHTGFTGTGGDEPTGHVETTQ